MSNSVETLPVAEPVPPASTALGLSRYCYLSFLSKGAMGEVWLVRDMHLHRPLAMKVIGAGLQTHPSIVARFMEEARITAQLSHPAIIPVHDLGILPDGRSFYTMPVVEGPRLSDVLGAWQQSKEESGWNLHKLLDVFRRICEAIGYAHSCGVVHRDVKPANIMVGAHGEVLVLDWGLAKVVGQSEQEPIGEQLLPSIESERAHQPELQTQAGWVFGTPAYMAPEQARGEGYRAGPAADVYALGGILWELLTGTPPSNSTTLAQAEPAELYRLAQAALAQNSSERPHAFQLAQGIASWQTGATRRLQALRLVDEADAAAKAATQFRTAAEAARQEAQQWMRHLKPLDSLEQKRPAWQCEDHALQMEREAEQAHLEMLRLLGAALVQVPDLAEAQDRLAACYQQLQAQAEATKDDVGAFRYERLLRQYDRGHYQKWLRGTGALTLHTEPTQARVLLYRYIQQDRHLVPVFERILGLSPLNEIPLAMGSWLLQIQAEGREDVYYPVMIGRTEHWDGIPPKETTPRPIYLPKIGELKENEVYIPCGWFNSGGDAEAIYSLPAQKTWLDGFILQRFPVTHRQYLAWLNHLVQQGQEALALQAAPRERPIREGELGKMVYQYHSERFSMVPDSEGELWNLDWPVMMVNKFAADKYAAYHGMRLPQSLEWEKAARGVDGRLYPWGNHLDVTFSRSMDSGPGRPLPAVKGEHPIDCSPYGLLGMAGNVRCWCQDPFPQQSPVVYVTRGGSWTAHPRGGRCARRSREAPQDGLIDLGIRLVRDV